MENLIEPIWNGWLGYRHDLSIRNLHIGGMRTLIWWVNQLGTWSHSPIPPFFTETPTWIDQNRSNTRGGGYLISGWSYSMIVFIKVHFLSSRFVLWLHTNSQKKKKTLDFAGLEYAPFFCDRWWFGTRASWLAVSVDMFVGWWCWQMVIGCSFSKTFGVRT